MTKTEYDVRKKGLEEERNALWDCLLQAQAEEDVPVLREAEEGITEIEQELEDLEKEYNTGIAPALLDQILDKLNDYIEVLEAEKINQLHEAYELNKPYDHDLPPDEVMNKISYLYQVAYGMENEIANIYKLVEQLERRI